MIDLVTVVTTISHSQKELIEEIGEGTRVLEDIRAPSRAEAVRTLKSLYFLIDRRLNDRMTAFTYQLNQDGLVVLDYLRHQREPSLRYG